LNAVILGFIVRLGGGSGGVDGAEDTKKNGDSTKIIGVPCRGPFLRDIAVLFLVTVVSMSYFQRGVIDYVFVHSMLGIYIVYVVLVFGADAYHIFYHLPRLARERDVEEENDTAKHGENEEVISVEYGKWKCGEHEHNGDRNASVAEPDHLAATNVHVVDECTPLVTHISSRSDESLTRKHRHRPHSHTLGDTVIEAISNYSCHEQHVHDNNSDECSEEEAAELAPLHPFSSALKPTGWGPKSPDGTEALVTFHPHHAIHPHHDKGQVVFRRASSNNSGVIRTLSHEESWESTGDEKATETDTACKSTTTASHRDSKDQRSVSETTRRRPSSWIEAWQVNVREWNEHWTDFFDDIYQNKENSLLEVILLSIELPFTILRKVTEKFASDTSNSVISHILPPFHPVYLS
jgi:hypothetical protein